MACAETCYYQVNFDSANLKEKIYSKYCKNRLRPLCCLFVFSWLSIWPGPQLQLGRYLTYRSGRTLTPNTQNLREDNIWTMPRCVKYMGWGLRHMFGPDVSIRLSASKLFGWRDLFVFPPVHSGNVACLCAGVFSHWLVHTKEQCLEVSLHCSFMAHLQ